MYSAIAHKTLFGEVYSAIAHKNLFGGIHSALQIIFFFLRVDGTAKKWKSS